MKQMKDMVNNNPQMARHMLVENPQLAYALLQASNYHIFQMRMPTTNYLHWLYDFDLKFGVLL